MPARHHIHRQSLTLETGEGGPGRGWHDRLEELQSKYLLPAMEAVFDGVEEGSHRTIDRLEITLTVSRPDRLEAEIGALVARELRRALRQSRREEATPSRMTGAEAFLYFLRTGNLHWSVASAADWLPELSALLRGWRTTTWDRLLRALRTDPVAHRRLLALPDSVLREVVDKLTPSEIREEILPDITTDREQLLAVINRLLTRATPPTSEVLPKQSPPKRKNEQAKPSPPNQPEPEEKPAWYPDNAGIVLLHPYLKYLLERVGCRPARERPNDSGRAATLLHYLVHGTTGCREWDLPLTKVLLGLHPDAYLQPADRLSEQELREADDVLTGVIDHWFVLGGSSPAALREGFLQRPGKLERAPTGWRLTVEERPHDVLLDRLPWPITPVRSPWMGELLQVDWR